jgi:DNA-binding GntR family transcriptional regulator
MNKKKIKEPLSNTLQPTPTKSDSQDIAVYNHIFDAILSQRLLPGTKLIEEELAGIFKVSRTVVRRALLRLSQECIVDIKLNRGASVACPSIKQAKEIIQARRIIEAEIIRDAVKLITPKQIKSLKKTVAEEQSNIEQNLRGKGIRLSGDFHLQLAKISNNQTLTKFIRELIPQTSLIIARYEKPGFANCSFIEHLELIDIIAKGDVEAAVELMNEHLLHIENKLDLTEYDHQLDLKDIFASID